VPGAAVQSSGPAERTNRKKTPLVVVAILITIVCVAFAIYFFASREKAGKQYVPAVTEPAPDVEGDHYAPIPPPTITDSSRSADTTHASFPPDSLGR
jgi:flagellar basal body-associated protein FliL